MSDDITDNERYLKDINMIIKGQTKLRERLEKLEQELKTAKIVYDDQLAEHRKEIAELKERVNDLTEFEHKYIPIIMKMESVLKRLFQGMGDAEDLEDLGYECLERLGGEKDPDAAPLYTIKQTWREKELIAEFLQDLESLPFETVTWVGEHKIRKHKIDDMGLLTSAMIFLPEITKLKLKWEVRLKNEYVRAL